MPGRTPQEAFKAFVEPLQAGISCIAQAKVCASKGGKDALGTLHSLYLTGSPRRYVPLSGVPLEFCGFMEYELIETGGKGDDRYRVTTKGYGYSIRTLQGERLVSWHWHPDGLSHETRPHMHLEEGLIGKSDHTNSKKHLIDERVTFETVVRNIIEFFGARPLVTDWDRRLHDSEDVHKMFRSWPTPHQPGHMPATD